jgi:hypothetical protein
LKWSFGKSPKALFIFPAAITNKTLYFFERKSKS